MMCQCSELLGSERIYRKKVNISGATAVRLQGRDRNPSVLAVARGSSASR